MDALVDKHRFLKRKGKRLSEKENDYSLKDIEGVLLDLGEDIVQQAHPVKKGQQHTPPITAANKLSRKPRRRMLNYQEERDCTPVTINFNKLPVTGIENPYSQYSLVSRELLSQANIDYQLAHNSDAVTELVDSKGNREPVIGTVILRHASGVTREWSYHDKFYVCESLPFGHRFVLGKRQIEMAERWVSHCCFLYIYPRHTLTKLIKKNKRSLGDL